MTAAVTAGLGLRIGQFVSNPSEVADAPKRPIVRPEEERGEKRPGRAGDPLLIDPRRGDFEDDASSANQRSLAAVAGSLFAEISLTKVAVAWVASILLPAVLLGVAPLAATAWVAVVSAENF